MSDNENRVERDQVLIDKIGKLLAVAASTKNEEERDAFTQRAMDLIAQNNLDMAAITEGGASAAAAKRADEKLKGGLYQFQRDIWEAVADLNFCMYWNLYTYVEGKVSKYWVRKYGGVANVPEWRKGGYTFQHRLVGRTVNIAATVAMCQYLEQTMDRLVRERLPNTPSDWWGSWAVAYREGMADEVVKKIRERRRQVLAEEQVKAAAAREAELEKTKGMESTGTSVTLSSVKKDEEQANYDFLNGDGAYAKKLAQRARWAQEQKEADEAYTKWAKANPEEARKQEEQRRKDSRRRTSWNAGTGSGGRDRASDKHSGAYWAGREKGESISIDQQMGDRSPRRLK